MSFHRILTYLGCLVVVASSCVTTTVTLQVLKPASMSLPASIQRVSIFPMAGLPERDGIFDSLTHIELSSDADFMEIKDGYLHGIYDVMSESPRFQKVVISDTSFRQRIVNGQLFWEDIEEICRHDTTGVLLLLQKAVTYDAVAEYGMPDIFINYNILNRSKWVFYSPESRTKLAEFSFSDTLLAAGYASTSMNDDLLYQVCYRCGQAAGTTFSPSWENHELRVFFIAPGKEMRAAARYVRQNRWVEAAMIWNRLAEMPNMRKASRAAFNLALAFERDDALDQASLWIAYADSLSDNLRIDMYKKELDTRLSLRPILDEQIAGE
jgi:hypothetical protein